MFQSQEFCFQLTLMKVPNEGHDGDDEYNVFQQIWSRQQSGQRLSSISIDDNKDEDTEEQWFGPKVSLGMLRNQSGKRWRVHEMEERMCFWY